MSFKPIVCTQCGAQNVSMITQDTCICNYCGTRFTIEKEHSSEPQVVIVHPVGEKQEDMGFFSLRPVCTPEQFAREAYIHLFSDPQTPQDIHKADFLPVVTEYPQFTFLIGDYALNYTVDIGHYRKEQYIDVQTRYVDGKTIKEQVVKTRTVTDWTPFSGSYRREDVITFGAVSLPEKSDIHFDFEEDEVLALQRYFAEHGSDGLECYDESGIAERIVPPSSADTQRAMERKAEELAYDCKQSLPGDTYQNFAYSVSSTAKDVDWMMAPEYALGFTYEGENYEVRSFASEIRTRLSKSPQQNAQREIEEELRSQKKKTLWLPMLGIAALYFLFLLLGIEDYVVLLVVAAIIYAVLHYKYWNRKVKQATTELVKERQEEKLQHLQRLLQAKGMAPVSEEEIALFFQ